MNTKKLDQVVKPKELVIYHCDRPKTLADLIEKVEEAFPGVPFENLVPGFGIVCFHVNLKK